MIIITDRRREKIRCCKRSIINICCVFSLQFYSNNHSLVHFACSIFGINNYKQIVVCVFVFFVDVSVCVCVFVITCVCVDLFIFIFIFLFGKEKEKQRDSKYMLTCLPVCLSHSYVVIVVSAIFLVQLIVFVGYNFVLKLVFVLFSE